MNGETCRQPPGRLRPSIDLRRCKGKGACAVVCPHDVFEIRKIDVDDDRRLGFLTRMKIRVHGGKVAYAPHADRCRACGLCVDACPEHAITLVKTLLPGSDRA